jgi:hypothetical protein
MKTEPVSLNNTPTPTHADLEIMPPDDVSFSKFCTFYFIASHVIGTPVFPYKHTNSKLSSSSSQQCPCLGPKKDFWVEFAFISFCFRCLHLQVFANAPLIFLGEV